MENMDRDLRQHISETIDGGAWEAVTSILWQDGTPWQLWKLERDIEFDGDLWRCVIVAKAVYDPDDPGAVDYAVDVISEAWMI